MVLLALILACVPVHMAVPMDLLDAAVLPVDSPRILLGNAPRRVRFGPYEAVAGPLNESPILDFTVEESGAPLATVRCVPGPPPGADLLSRNPLQLFALSCTARLSQGDLALAFGMGPQASHEGTVDHGSWHLAVRDVTSDVTGGRKIVRMGVAFLDGERAVAAVDLMEPHPMVYLASGLDPDQARALAVAASALLLAR